MIMKITVGLAILLIMLVTEERLLTLGTSKMFNMPMFPHGSDNSLFNWSPVILNYKKVSLTSQKKITDKHHN